MECKVTFKRFGAVHTCHWNITRMECKEDFKTHDNAMMYHWNITRMECKVTHIYGVLHGMTLEYNQNGM